MIAAWWITIGAVVVAVAAIGVCYAADIDWPIIVAGVALLAVVIFGVAGLVVSLQRHYGRVACRTFAAQTQRRTRFVVYTSWTGGDCLTPTANGKWIPTTNLREFGATR